MRPRRRALPARRERRRAGVQRFEARVASRPRQTPRVVRGPSAPARLKHAQEVDHDIDRVKFVPAELQRLLGWARRCDGSCWRQQQISLRLEQLGKGRRERLPLARGAADEVGRWHPPPPRRAVLPHPRHSGSPSPSNQFSAQWRCCAADAVGCRRRCCAREGQHRISSTRRRQFAESLLLRP